MTASPPAPVPMNCAKASGRDAASGQRWRSVTATSCPLPPKPSSTASARCTDPGVRGVDDGRMNLFWKAALRPTTTDLSWRPPLPLIIDRAWANEACLVDDDMATRVKRRRMGEATLLMTSAVHLLKNEMSCRRLQATTDGCENIPMIYLWEWLLILNPGSLVRPAPPQLQPLTHPWQQAHIYVPQRK